MRLGEERWLQAPNARSSGLRSGCHFGVGPRETLQRARPRYAQFRQSCVVAQEWRGKFSDTYRGFEVWRFQIIEVQINGFQNIEVIVEPITTCVVPVATCL